jgi:hypothetical protein
MSKSSSYLFQKTRWQLTLWYAGVISILLTLLGTGVYQAIIHAYRATLEQELVIVAGILHDNLQTVLTTPETLDENIRFFLPDLCQVSQPCLALSNRSNHRINPLKQGQYYIQLFNLSGELLAISGQQPQGADSINQKKSWEIIQDSQGFFYLQISHLLHTQSDQNWGYLRVGRSLEEFDNYLQKVGLILLLGLPLAVLLVGLAAWWLAGLAIAFPTVMRYSNSNGQTSYEYLFE